MNFTEAQAKFRTDRPWFEARGITTPFLWNGPDGLIRGSGRQ